MQYGFIIPGADSAQTIVDLAEEAEQAGWDGVFYWDGIDIAEVGDIYDPWVLLSAIATRTQRVRLGAIITPLSRRRPWKVARETATLDHLSNGRLVLPVGLGALDDGGFKKVNEVTDRKTRAELLDESLDILTGLWSGHPFSFTGKHYRIDEMHFKPAPVQKPRIPIWVVGAWPGSKSMQRVVKYDGILPNKLASGGESGQITPDDIRAIKTYVEEHRTLNTPFDIIWEGQTPGDDPARAQEIIQPYAEAGATWWMEAYWSFPPTAELRKRIQQGPPRLS